MVSPHLKLFFLRAFGKEYRFNGMSRWFLNRSSWELPSWTFEARGDGVRLIGEIDCHPDELVGVTYTDTDGSQFWCHNTKVASCAPSAAKAWHRASSAATFPRYCLPSSCPVITR